MAVQAQHPSIAFRVHNNVLENFEDLQYGVGGGGGENQSISISSSRMILFGRSNCNYGHNHQVLNGTVFSDPAESELTCNVVSASRKRKNRDDQMHHLNTQHQHPHPQNVVSSHNYFPSRIAKLTKVEVSTIGDVQKSFEENRFNQSEWGVSTSGRRYDDVDDDAALLISPTVPPLLQYQNLDEIDALIRLQHETLRSVVEQTQQRQCRLLLSVLEQQVLRRLREKQIELENACRRNAELEEKVKQMSAENQMWFNVAKNNEAMALSLRSTLEHQVLSLHHHHHHHQKTTMMMTTKGGQAKVVVVEEEEEEEEEGFGDSGDGVADDAQSNNNNCQLQVNVGEREYKTVTTSNDVVLDHHRDGGDDASMQQQQQQQQQHRKMCKVCVEKEVSVLLLPCRHLCLCKDCEAKLQTCPICNSLKNASLQIFMS